MCVSVCVWDEERTRHGGRQGERGIHLAEERTGRPRLQKRESGPARATSISSSSRSSSSGCSGKVVVGCTLLRWAEAAVSSPETIEARAIARSPSWRTPTAQFIVAPRQGDTLIVIGSPGWLFSRLRDFTGRRREREGYWERAERNTKRNGVKGRGDRIDYRDDRWTFSRMLI